MPKNKGLPIVLCLDYSFFCLCFFFIYTWASFYLIRPGKGGKNRKRGKGGNDMVKRELVLKVEGQG